MMIRLESSRAVPSIEKILLTVDDHRRVMMMMMVRMFRWIVARCVASVRARVQIDLLGRRAALVLDRRQMLMLMLRIQTHPFIVHVGQRQCFAGGTSLDVRLLVLVLLGR